MAAHTGLLDNCDVGATTLLSDHGVIPKNQEATKHSILHKKVYY